MRRSGCGWSSCTERASGMERGGGTPPPRSWPSRASPAWHPPCPAAGETGEPADARGPGLAADVAAVRDVLTASDEPTVVVAHSYGGIVTAEAAAGIDAVRHLLLVSSDLPEVGQSLSSFGGEEPAPFLDIDPDGGTFTVRPQALPRRSCRTAPRRSSDRPWRRPPGRAWPSWRSRCGRRPGRTCPPPISSARMERGHPRRPAACVRRPGGPRGGKLQAGHHPFLSRPGDVRDLIAGL